MNGAVKPLFTAHVHSDCLHFTNCRDGPALILGLYFWAGFCRPNVVCFVYCWLSCLPPLDSAYCCLVRLTAAQPCLLRLSLAHCCSVLLTATYYCLRLLSTHKSPANYCLVLLNVSLSYLLLFSSVHCCLWAITKIFNMGGEKNCLRIYKKLNLVWSLTQTFS